MKVGDKVNFYDRMNKKGLPLWRKGQVIAINFDICKILQDGKKKGRCRAYTQR